MSKTAKIDETIPQQAIEQAEPVAATPTTFEATIAAVAEIEGAPDMRCALHGAALQQAMHQRRQAIFRAARERNWPGVAQLLPGYKEWYGRAVAYSRRMAGAERRFAQWDAEHSTIPESLAMPEGGVGVMPYDFDEHRLAVRAEFGLNEPPPLD